MRTRREEQDWLPVGTVMTENALTVRPETPIHFATGLMVANRLTTLPVVDGRNRLVGIVTDADVISYVIDRTSPESSRPPSRGPVTVADLMRPPTITVDDESPLLEAAVALAHSKLSRLVVTHRGHVVGTIGRIEVLGAMLSKIGWAESMPTSTSAPATPNV